MLTKIVAPTNNVNDTSVVVFELLVENNSKIKAGDKILAIETSKATENIECPADGFIRFVVSVGDEIPNGDLLALVADTIEELDGAVVQPIETVTSPITSVISPATPSAISVSEVNNTVTHFGIFGHAVTLGEIMAKSGDKVEADAVLCKVRDGRTTETIKAPSTGYVFWHKKPYETVKAGETIGIISGSSDYKQPIDVPMVTTVIKYNSLRVSKAAQQMLTQKGMTAERLGLSGLVTVKTIEERMNSKKTFPVTSSAPVAPTPATHLGTGRFEKLSKAKRSEAKFLSDANRDAVVSQASVLVPTRGIISACAEDPELARKFSTIIIFETSRLLKSYPTMTSVYDDGKLFIYDEINVGYALAIDDGLKVPVFKNSDQKDIETLIEEKNQFMEKYISRELSAENLSGGTFTITDLSSTGCYMFNPVLNFGQSVILGVGGENTAHTDYPLILAYDHRVVDGATATEFLCALRDRLVAHENVLLGKSMIEDNASDTLEDTIDIKNLACDSCYRSAEELDEMGYYLFKVINKKGKEKHICSICMRGW